MEDARLSLFIAARWNGAKPEYGIEILPFLKCILNLYPVGMAQSPNTGLK